MIPNDRHEAKLTPSSLGLRDFGWPRLFFTQYLIGVALNLAFVLVLLSQTVTWRNLQLPEGAYRQNIWRGLDVMTYVNPARNFLDFGVFGSGMGVLLSVGILYQYYQLLVQEQVSEMYPALRRFVGG